MGADPPSESQKSISQAVRDCGTMLFFYIDSEVRHGQCEKEEAEESRQAETAAQAQDETQSAQQEIIFGSACGAKNL
jgi:hypothetical protein